MVPRSRPGRVESPVAIRSAQALPASVLDKAWAHRASPADRIRTLERAATILAATAQLQTDPIEKAILSTAARIAQETALGISAHAQTLRR